MFHSILTVNGYDFRNSFHLLVFVMEKQYEYVEWKELKFV
jgi:hypothetical protein